MEKYLPIGSVVMLKGGTKRVMVTGFCTVPNEDKEKVYDYSGCLYPEGVISTEQVLLFNHSDIEKIYYLGYIDDEEKNFKERLLKVLETGK
mgnify:CR=1 FL=1|jgi:hypothetical protein